MNRTPSIRVAAFLLAVLFLLTGAESAFGMRPCPHHDGVAESAGGPPSHAMAGHHMAGGGHHSDGQQPGHSGPCTCQGACQMGSAAALPEAAVTTPVAKVAGVEAPPLLVEEILARALTPFFLPYSQAPPRLG